MFAELSLMPNQTTECWLMKLFTVPNFPRKKGGITQTKKGKKTKNTKCCKVYLHVNNLTCVTHWNDNIFC